MPRPCRGLAPNPPRNHLVVKKLSAPRLEGKQAQVEEKQGPGPPDLRRQRRLRRLAGTPRRRPKPPPAPTAASSKGKAATIVYGKSSYKLAAGAKGKISVKDFSTRQGKELLREHAQATVTLRLTPKGGTATTAKLILTRSVPEALRGRALLPAAPAVLVGSWASHRGPGRL